MRNWIDLFEARYPRFSGHGGRCGQAAVAINRVVFRGRGKLVGAFNKAFYEAGRLTGHVAVYADGQYWDGDAQPKTADEIESWGMLDPSDIDYAEFAAEHGITWNDDAASEVIWVEMTEEEALATWGRDNLPEMMRTLGWNGVDRKL